MKKLFWLFIFCCCAVFNLIAQKQEFAFNNLSEKDGLKNNIVFSMLKDSRGILWVGTQNGLNSFDGTHFYSFKKNRDLKSLPNNTIQCLAEDKNGNIWGGTDNGVFCYSTAQNKFTTYNAPKAAYDNTIQNILCDKDGNIFATTTIAIMKFNHQKNVFEFLVNLTNSKDSIGWYGLGKNRMQKDEKTNALWLATPRGLFLYDIKSNKLSASFNNSSNPLFINHSTSALCKSVKGNFWYCDNTTKEIISFSPSSKTILQKISVKKDAPDARGSTILEDSQNRLWFSSWSFDLLAIDLANNNINSIKSGEAGSNTVASQFFWAATEDDNGTVWLGTPNGISMCNPGKSVYKACHLPDKIPELKTTQIYLFNEDPTDYSWWLVTGNLKLIHYFPATEKYSVYELSKAVPNKQGQLPSGINRLRFYGKNVIITTSKGAWQLNANTKSIVPWKILPDEYSGLVITDFIEADSILYLTDNLKMLVWNKNTKQGSWITSKNGDLPAATKFGFQHLLWKPNQKFYWTLSGDYIASTGTNYQANLVKLIKNDTQEAGGYFHAADMDNDGNIWVINKGVGLYRYAPRTNQIKYWNDLDGLADSHLHSVTADDKGNIWTFYFNKVSVFNPAKNSFINFNIPYSENSLNYYNCSVKRADGVVMGSINNDMFEFYNANIGLIPVNKKIQLSSVSVSGTEHYITTENSLNLNPDENSLRFKFGLLDDASVYPHQFEYMLDGVDKKWVQAANSNEAVYNNLPPGTYIFHLLAKGKNSGWQTEEKLFTIIIKTPFYKTFWFRSLLLLLTLGGLFLFYRNRLSQKEKLMKLESKTQLLEKEKTMVMYDSLKQQLNPHFLFNSLTSLSGLIETDQQVAGNFLQQMSGIYRYILKNGDNETVPLKDELEFVKLYINLQQTRFKKGLQVNINVPEEYRHYKIAPVTLQNLIENAIKHNIIDTDSPLVIDIFIENEYIVVKNNLQKKNMVETSNKKGLAQFETLYKYLSERPIVIEETTQNFIIKIPLI